MTYQQFEQLVSMTDSPQPSTGELPISVLRISQQFTCLVCVTCVCEWGEGDEQRDDGRHMPWKSLTFEIGNFSQSPFKTLFVALLFIPKAQGEARINTGCFISI